jgi:hypothetical protein
MNMRVLKRSRTLPREGDIFAYKVRGHAYGFGRVIRLGTTIGGFEDVILVYFYRAFSSDKNKVPALAKERLLLPPLGTDRGPWTRGYFETMVNRPLLPDDILPVHCFKDTVEGRFCDEYGRTLKAKSKLCVPYALDGYRTLDAQISIALGVDPSPDTLPPAPPPEHVQQRRRREYEKYFADRRRRRR